MKKRDSWKNRATFIFAAIGSAVGLGNAWRFPGLAAKHGGGTFILVYLVALFLLGWPLLLMELSIGRKTKQGAINAMRTINKKAEFVGWASVLNAFFIVTYYAVILAWIFMMIIKSFKIGGLSPNQAGGVFFNDVLKYKSLTTAGAFDIPLVLIIMVVIAWLSIYLSIRKGAHSAGKIVPYTVIIPVVLLVILAINGIVKDIRVAGGAGLKVMFTPQASAFKNSTLWIDAFGQVFYSLSIMMAIMIAYGSFVDKDSNLIKDSFVIAVSDAAISILAGIVLFTTLSGTGTLDSFLKDIPGSIGTAFVVYPKAMVMLSKSAALNSFFSLMFYLTLLTLAIDSAFSIVEGISTAISDKFHLNKRKTTRNICFVAGTISLLFITKAGLEWLDIVDNWINAFTLIIIGILECLFVGWFFKTSKVREHFNSNSKMKINVIYDYIIKIVAPLVLATLFVWNFISIIKSYTGGGKGYGGYPIYAQILGGWIVVFLTFGISIIMSIVSRKNKRIAELDMKLKSWDELN